MKKIIFLIHVGDIKKSSGIIQKIINQSKALHKHNMLFKTIVFYKVEESKIVKNMDIPEYVEFKPLNYYKKYKNIIKSYIVIQKIYFEYIKVCNEYKNNYDYIYVRMNPVYYGFIKFVNKFKQKIIFEHNSNELDEYKANKAFYKVIKLCIFGKYICSKAKGFVAVTREIYEYEKKFYKCKGVVITNGVDVKKYKLRNIPKFNGKELNMIFVGNIRYWHGLERIINSLAQYKGQININLNICGLINQEDDYITPMIKAIDNPKIKINLLGYKTQKELDEIFDKSHIAIGCLGIYKKNIKYASVLKNREYFARGIPVVFSEIDEDICKKENKRLYFKVPNNSSNIDINKLISFVKQFYQNAQANSLKIRKFAENNLDFYEKEKRLKELL